MSEHIHSEALVPYLEAKIEALSREYQKLITENATLRLKLIGKELRGTYAGTLGRIHKETEATTPTNAA